MPLGLSDGEGVVGVSTALTTLTFSAKKNKKKIWRFKKLFVTLYPVKECSLV